MTGASPSSPGQDADAAAGGAQMPAQIPAQIRPLCEVKREAIEAAIAACGGNVVEAAQRLGISAKTIYRKRRHWRAKPAV